MKEFTSIKGIIFDNDGVLVNSEDLSCRALQVLLKDEFSINVGPDFSDVIGSSDKFAISFYLEKYNIPLPQNFSELITRKQDIYFSLAKNKLTSFDGLNELLEFLQENKILTGIASSGTREKIKFSIQELNIKTYFNSITSVTEVDKGKPHPDVYLKASERLGIKPEYCIAVEDSLLGIEGVKRAGMYAVGFSSSFSANDLYRANADIVVSDFNQFLSLLKKSKTEIF